MTRQERYETDRREHDKKMIMNPDSWPLWPRLPLKRWHGDWGNDEYLGVLYDPASERGGGAHFVVHVGLMFTHTQRTIVYSDLDALVQDWRVD